MSPAQIWKQINLVFSKFVKLFSYKHLTASRNLFNFSEKKDDIWSVHYIREEKVLKAIFELHIAGFSPSLN